MTSSEARSGSFTPKRSSGVSRSVRNHAEAVTACARRSGSLAAGRVESRGERNGRHAELRRRNRQDVDPDSARGGFGRRGLDCRFRNRHSCRQAERSLRHVLYDQTAGDRAWLVDLAHDRRSLRRPDLGGKPPRRWSGVSFHTAAVQRSFRMTSTPASILVVDDDASFRTAIGALLTACGYKVALYESARAAFGSAVGQ